MTVSSEKYVELLLEVVFRAPVGETERRSEGRPC